MHVFVVQARARDGKLHDEGGGVGTVMSFPDGSRSASATKTPNHKGPQDRHRLTVVERHPRGHARHVVRDSHVAPPDDSTSSTKMAPPWTSAPVTHTSSNRATTHGS